MDDFIAAQWAEPEIRAVIFTFILGGLATLIGRFLTPRGRLIWAISHQHAFQLPREPVGILVETRELWIQNVGRANTEDIEIVLNFIPQHWDVWPIVPTDSIILPNSRIAIKIKNLTRGEVVTISMFESRDGVTIPDVLSIRWLGGVARRVTMGPQRIWPMWLLRLGLLVLSLGILAIIYVLIRVTQLAVG